MAAMQINYGLKLKCLPGCLLEILLKNWIANIHYLVAIAVFKTVENSGY